MSREEEQLEREVILGEKAERAYTAYLQDLFASERLDIFNRFCCADTDPDTLANVKHEQMALDNLEQVTLTHIETGKMAKQQLNDLVRNNNG